MSAAFQIQADEFAAWIAQENLGRDKASAAKALDFLRAKRWHIPSVLDRAEYADEIVIKAICARIRQMMTPEDHRAVDEFEPFEEPAEHEDADRPIFHEFEPEIDDTIDDTFEEFVGDEPSRPDPEPWPDPTPKPKHPPPWQSLRSLSVGMCILVVGLFGTSLLSSLLAPVVDPIATSPAPFRPPAVNQNPTLTIFSEPDPPPAVVAKPSSPLRTPSPLDQAMTDDFARGLLKQHMESARQLDPNRYQEILSLLTYLGHRVKVDKGFWAKGGRWHFDNDENALFNSGAHHHPDLLKPTEIFFPAFYDSIRHTAVEHQHNHDPLPYLLYRGILTDEEYHFLSRSFDGNDPPYSLPETDLSNRISFEEPDRTATCGKLIIEVWPDQIFSPDVSLTACRIVLGETPSGEQRWQYMYERSSTREQFAIWFDDKHSRILNERKAKADREHERRNGLPPTLLSPDRLVSYTRFEKLVYEQVPDDDGIALIHKSNERQIMLLLRNNCSAVRISKSKDGDIYQDEGKWFVGKLGTFFSRFDGGKYYRNYSFYAQQPQTVPEQCIDRSAFEEPDIEREPFYHPDFPGRYL